jgi:nitroreductase
VEISRDDLLELVELARLTSTAGNLQPYKYILSYEPDKNSLIFQYLSWAGRLKEWDGPKEAEGLLLTSLS